LVALRARGRYEGASLSGKKTTKKTICGLGKMKLKSKEKRCISSGALKKETWGLGDEKTRENFPLHANRGMTEPLSAKKHTLRGATTTEEMKGRWVL